MKAFAALVLRLEDASTDAQRLDALCTHWSSVPAADAAWALRLLAGRGIGRRLVPHALREATCRVAGLEPWLFDACLEASGDWAETVAHALPPGSALPERPLARWMGQELSARRAITPEASAGQALGWCAELDTPGRELLLRLLLGRWRRLASDALLRRALSRHAGVDERLLALRWSAWMQPGVQPDAAGWTALLQHGPASQSECLLPHASAPVESVEGGADTLPDRLGDATAWSMLELQGGERVQLVRRDAGCAMWSVSSGRLIDTPANWWEEVESGLPPDSVIEGEWLERVGTVHAPHGLFRITDMLLMGGRDLRTESWDQRIAFANTLLMPRPLVLGQPQAVEDWSSLTAQWATARSRGVDALLLVRRDAAYGAPCSRVEWRTPPWRATVLLQSVEHGIDDAGIACIDLGVALWTRRPPDAAAVDRAVAAAQQGERLPAAAAQLVPITKLRVALPAKPDGDKLLGEGWTQWLREATVQHFGPVRWLRLQRACDIGFDGVVPTRRRRSGLELRGARFLGWRDDLQAAVVDDLSALRERLNTGRR